VPRRTGLHLFWRLKLTEGEGQWCSLYRQREASGDCCCFRGFPIQGPSLSLPLSLSRSVSRSSASSSATSYLKRNNIILPLDERIWLTCIVSKRGKLQRQFLWGKISLNAWEFSHSPPPSPPPLPPPPTHFFSAFETLRKGGGGGGGGVEGEEGGGKAVEGTPGLLLSHKPGYRPSKKTMELL
jgi:hypothetical protein